MSRRVLLLNASYEPLLAISWQRAVILLVDGHAETIETAEGEIRSPSTSIPFPSVIRLLRYVKIPTSKREMPISRRAILNRDDRKCAYCLKPADTIDHIHPRSKGGKHRWNNVVAACRRCNAVKGNRFLSELQKDVADGPDPQRWHLKIKPTDPGRNRWLILGVTDDKWEKYLPSLTSG